MLVLAFRQSITSRCKPHLGKFPLLPRYRSFVVRTAVSENWQNTLQFNICGLVLLTKLHIIALEFGFLPIRWGLISNNRPFFNELLKRILEIERQNVFEWTIKIQIWNESGVYGN